MSSLMAPRFIRTMSPFFRASQEPVVVDHQTALRLCLPYPRVVPIRNDND